MSYSLYGFNEVKNKSLTVSMYPSMLTENDNLLKAQLQCLSVQINKDFDVYLLDHHYNKRKHYIKDLAETYQLDIKHVPYQPNPHVAKTIDAGIFNTGFIFSENKNNVRLSDWRFVKPDFTDICIYNPTAVDFYFHNCEPASKEDADPQFGHPMSIWDKTKDMVNWAGVPEVGQKGASWTIHSKTIPADKFPLNCYGNICVNRNDWLVLNGCDETFTNSAHYEDMDFCLRANRAGLQCARYANVMYRLHHIYSPYSGRANVPPDGVFTAPCNACDDAMEVLEPKRFDIKNRLEKNEIEIINHVWICKTCKLCGPVYHTDPGEHLHASQSIKSNIIPKYLLGRDLIKLTSDMDGQSLEKKIAIFYDSYTNPRYY